MEPTTILLTAGGAVGMAALGWLAAVFSENRAERRRKLVELEKAYQAWLDNEAIVRARFKRVSQAVTRCARSEELEKFQTEFETGRTELQALNTALNKAIIYETDAFKKRLIEVQLRYFQTMMDTLGVALDSYRIMFDCKNETANCARTLATYDELIAEAEPVAPPHLWEKLQSHRSEAAETLERRHELNEDCSRVVRESSESLLRHLETVEGNADDFRRALVA
jgi:hypothetical protein